MKYIPLVVFHTIYEVDLPSCAPVIQSLYYKLAHHQIHHIMVLARPLFGYQYNSQQHLMRHITS